MHSYVTSKNVKWRHLIWPTLYVITSTFFYVFMFFFQNPSKNSWLFTFFDVFRTFSRTIHALLHHIQITASQFSDKPAHGVSASVAPGRNCQLQQVYYAVSQKWYKVEGRAKVHSWTRKWSVYVLSNGVISNEPHWPPKSLTVAVAEWYGAGLAIARSRVRIPPATAVHQRQISVPSLWGRLMSTSDSWGVNGHTMRCTSPVSVVLRLRLVFGWRLVNGDQRRPMGPWGSGKDFTLLRTLLSDPLTRI